MKYIKNIIQWFGKKFSNKTKIADNLFTIIILFVSITSFFHVVDYWRLTNAPPFNIITGIATELIIFGSILAIRTTRAAWVTFVLGAVVQGLGNVFYSYMQIDVNGTYFISFMELFKPIFEMMYGDELEIMHYKRILSMFNGMFYMVAPIVFLIAKTYLVIENVEKPDNDNSTTIEEINNEIQIEEEQISSALPNEEIKKNNEVVVQSNEIENTQETQNPNIETYSDFMEYAYNTGEAYTPKNVLKDLLSDLNEDRVELNNGLTERQMQKHLLKTK